jgi:hypothetical protein
MLIFFCPVGRVAGDPQIRRHVFIKIEGIKTAAVG